MRRERERSSREADVLAAAERVFTRHGYHVASMAEIAREAGYAVGSLYKFFDSKDELFLKLLERRIQDFDRVVEESLASATEPCMQLEAVAVGIARHSARERAFLSLFVSPTPGVFDSFGLDAPSIRRHIQRTEALLRAVIVRGQQRGDFTEKLRADVILLAFTASVRAYKLEEVIKQRGDPDEEELRTLVRALLRGFSP